MQDFELQKIWKDYDRKLEESKILNLQSWALNLKSFEMMQQLKATTKLNKLVIIKILVALLGLIWSAFLLLLVTNLLYFSKIFFIFSASAIAIITFAAVIVYVKHIILIRNINNTEAVVDVQKKIASLQASTIQITRILFLQTPFYCTWFVNVNDVINGHPGFWFITFPITILFTMAAIWLYRNIDIRNKDKKWFKLLFSGAEWTYLVKAEAFINEIDTFKANN
jgi:hypothetical protein